MIIKTAARSDLTKPCRRTCGALRNLLPFVQFKKREKHPWRVLILVKLQDKACNFTKINTPPWFFFHVFKLGKWYQIAQRIT